MLPWLPLLSAVPVDLLACYLYPLYKSILLLSSGSLRSEQASTSAKIAVSRRANQPLRLVSRNIAASFDPSASVVSAASTTLTSHSSKSSRPGKLTGPNAHLYDDYVNWGVFWVLMMPLNFLTHWLAFLPYFYFIKVVLAFFLSHPGLRGGLFLYNRCWRDVRRKSLLQKNYLILRRRVLGLRERARLGAIRRLDPWEHRCLGCVCRRARRRLLGCRKTE